MDASRLPRTVLEKWSEPVLAEGFVPFPKRLLRTMSQFFAGSQAIEELAVVLAIVDFKRPNVTRLPSLSYLAFLAGLDESEFKQALTRLNEKGLIRVQGTQEGLDVGLGGLLDEILSRSAKRKQVEGDKPSDADREPRVPAARHFDWSEPPSIEAKGRLRKRRLELDESPAAKDPRSGEGT